MPREEQRRVPEPDTTRGRERGRRPRISRLKMIGRTTGGDERAQQRKARECQSSRRTREGGKPAGHAEGDESRARRASWASRRRSRRRSNCTRRIAEELAQV